MNKEDRDNDTAITSILHSKYEHINSNICTSSTNCTKSLIHCGGVTVETNQHKRER